MTQVCSCLSGERLIRFLLGPGQRHIETTRVVQEANALVLVGTHTRQDDEIFFSALESINAGNLYFLQCDGTQGEEDQGVEMQQTGLVFSYVTFLSSPAHMQMICYVWVKGSHSKMFELPKSNSYTVPDAHADVCKTSAITDCLDTVT